MAPEAPSGDLATYDENQPSEELPSSVTIIDSEAMNFYSVSIRGPNLNATYRVANVKDLDVVKSALELIRPYVNDET